MKFAKVLLIATLVLGAAGCGKKKENKNDKEPPVTDLNISQEK